MENPEFHTVQELEIILSSTKNLRHKLQILIMADAGLRVTEMLNLKWSNCDFKKNLIEVSSLKKKKAESRFIPITNRLYACFSEILQKEKPDLKGYLFAGNDGKPVSRQSVNIMLKRLEGETPELSEVHPHKLRHTFATNLRANGAEIEDIRDLLGHESIDTSLIYAHADQSNLRRLMEGKKADLSFFDRCKVMIFPEKKVQKINLTVHDTSLIIGRNDEIKEIEENINKGLDIILIGKIGIGKTHIFENLKISKKCLEMDECKDFKKSILNILLYLCDGDKEATASMILGTFDKNQFEKKMSTDSVPNLLKILKRLTNPNEYILKIGDLENLTPGVAKYLAELNGHFQIITTARKVKMEHTAFLWNFKKIEIKPLSRTESLKLFHRITDHLDFENIEFTRNRVFDTSEGNPKMIVDLADRFGKEQVLTGEIVDEITSGYLGKQSKNIDMSVYLMLILVGVAAMKFLGKETEDKTLRNIGSLVMLVMLFARYFVRAGRSNRTV